MLKEKILSISIFCLSISIIISSAIIAKGMEDSGNYIGSGMYNMSGQLAESIHNAVYDINENSQDNMNIDTAASYLGLTVNDLVKVIHTEGIGFPYVKVGSNFIINKNALDKWLETARIEIK
jgi:excisionase family DNA binding protein